MRDGRYVDDVMVCRGIQQEIVQLISTTHPKPIFLRNMRDIII